MVRLGLLGAGQVAKKHARAISVVEGAQLVAVSDVDEARGRQLASDYGAEYQKDYAQLLKMDLDAVINCLPHYLHHRSTLEAAAQGLHILLEKPMCLTMDEGKDILAACKRANVRLMMGFVHRFRQETLDAKELIDQGQLGQVTTGADMVCAPMRADVPGWVWHKAYAGGGVLMYTGVHGVDRMRWLVGSEVRRVYARTRTYSASMDVEDGLVAFLEFENGAVVMLTQNAPRYGADVPWRTELYGSKGMVSLIFNESLQFFSAAQSYTRTYQRYDHFAREISEFVAAIEEGREPWINGRDGILSQAICLGIYESARTGRPVELKDLLEGIEL